MSCIAPSAFLTLALIALVVSFTSRRHHHTNDVSSSIVQVAPISLFVDGSSPVATVDENFVCATLDWWPREKCNYGSCSWHHSSILNLDLTNIRLVNSVKALSPLLIRLGGSLQDQVIYDVRDSLGTCSSDFRTTGTFIRFGFSTGCLSMSRWQQLNEFFQATGTRVAFGLNALYGRKQRGQEYTGAWNSSNARDFIKFSHDKAYQIIAWELGNELTGGVGVQVDPEQYAADVKELRTIIDDVYRDIVRKPLVVAPDGFFDYSWYDQFLQHTKDVDAVSVHVYNLGPGNGVNITGTILNAPLSGVYQAVERVVERNQSRVVKAWVGESGGVFNGGQHLVSDTFVFSFWYLDQLGQAALHNIGVFCRQTLVGGNYGLLDSGFNPNPDFYSALLWKKLMGETVFNLTSGGLSSSVHAYSHCLKGSRGGLAVLIINFSGEEEQVVDFPGLKTRKLEYHLSSASGDIQSSKVMLNGRVLEASENGEVPEMRAIEVEASKASRVAPHTIAFIAFPEALVPACTL